MGDEKYRSIFQNMASGLVIFAYDIAQDDFFIMEINDAACRMENVRADQVIGKRLNACFPLLLEPVRKVHRSGVPTTHTIQEHRENRDAAWIVHSLFQLPSGEIVSLFNDETERMLKELTHEASVRKLRAVIHASPLGICFTTDRRIEWVNETFSRMTGYDRDDLYGKNLRIFYEDDAEYDRVGKVLYLDCAGSEYVTARTQWKRKDGSILNCSIRKSVLKDETRIGGCVMAVADISARLKFEKDQQRLEALLLHAQKMECLGILAGGIAHDFNNILFPIMGYTEMMMMETTDKTTLSCLDGIMSAVNRSRELVHQILSFSRQKIEAETPMTLQPLIKETVKFLKASLPSTICIDYSIDSECEAVVADAAQMHQVLMNLCTNAYHALEETGSRGTIHISLGRAEIGKEEIQELCLLEPGRFIVLTVSDTGPGIPSEIKTRIFDPYFTTKHPEKGSGIGLSVVHAIVKRYSGAILVDSEPDAGCAFRVYLPVASLESEPDSEIDKKGAATPPAISLLRGNGRVLLVDDEREIVLLMQKILTRQGYRVTCFMDSVKALDAFKDNPSGFDVVITDLTMPEITGIDMAEKIKALRPDIPIIMCTGFGDDKIPASQQKNDLFTEIFKKPVVMSALIECIQNLE